MNANSLKNNEKLTSNQTPLESKEELNDNFKRLCMSSEGILYQDENIQIGFKSEYSNGVGRMMLYYGNVLLQPLLSFNTSISTGSYISF
jgi:AP-2 complex subunit alpha